MDPARHKVLWDGKDVTPDRHRVPDPRGARPAPGRRQDPQPAARRRLSGRRLCRRPHHRQPHQAHPPQVPRESIPTSMLSRPSMASDTVSTSNEDEADLALSWSGRWSPRAPDPRGQRADHRCSSRSSTLYLDVFRNRLSKERVRQTRIEATADRRRPFSPPAPEDREPILAAISKSTGNRLAALRRATAS